MSQRMSHRVRLRTTRGKCPTILQKLDYLSARYDRGNNFSLIYFTNKKVDSLKAFLY